MGQTMSRIKKGAGVAALAVSIIGGFEGMRTVAYQDVVGVWTICAGETLNVRRGMTMTIPACNAMLLRRLDEFADGVERCVPSAKDMPAARYVSHVSIAYNIGIGGYCKSSIARLTNAGYVRAGCDALMKYNRAGGVVFPGLTRRRAAERELCLRGL